MSARGIRILFILAYSNPLYDAGLAPYTDEGRTAFARFAAAAATHYTGRGILWEIWNEPNLDQFWKPQPNAQDYAALASTTIKAVRQADPNAFVIGPAVCCFASRTWNFMDSLGKSGILNEFDAVTIHPYGSPMPELAERDYLYLRHLVEKYSPERNIPIYVGEWGFSDNQPGLNQARQAEYLTRIWLINLANNID